MCVWKYTSLVVLWLLLVDKGASKCHEGYFLVTGIKLCKKCSTSCPEEDVDMPCTEFADVLCKSSPLSAEHTNTGSIPHGGDGLGVIENENSEWREIDSSGGLELTLEEKHDWRHWKTLAFALIALLCVLIIMATIVVVVACLKLQQALVSKQTEELDIDDADSGYVVIRTIRDVTGPQAAYSEHSLYSPEELSAHPPLLASQDTGIGGSEGPSSSSSPPQSLCFLPRVYTPQRRLLTYDADDVFESDDQAQHPFSAAREPSSSIHQVPRFTGNVQLVQDSVRGAYSSSLLSQPGKRNKIKWKADQQRPETDTATSGVGCFGRKQKGRKGQQVDIV